MNTASRRTFLGFVLTPRTAAAFLIAAAILGVGLYASIVRFFVGLGASTNLTDLAPWGLWIGFDVMAGEALAAGGFVIAGAVHIFHLRRYEPLLRPAILTAFLGYLLGVFGLLFDIGQPWRIWHPLIYWNVHSVLFLVAWCVILYTTVLALEFAPVVFERLRLKRPRRILRAVTIPLIILGITLSTMHQSALGAMFLIFPEKLGALWYTPILPLLFFVSAVMVGLAMVTVESLLSARLMGREAHMDLLDSVARATAVALVLYFVLKLADVTLRGAWSTLLPLRGDRVAWLAEISLTVVLPALLLASRRVRASWSGLLLSQGLVVLGVVANRMNLAVLGLVSAAGGSYFPGWMEFAVTLALLTAGVVGFALAAKHLPVFEGHEEPGLT